MWFAANWTKANWFANNWFAGQQVEEVQTPAGGFFGYGLDGGRKRRREDDVFEIKDVVAADVQPVPSRSARPITAGEIAAARAWIGGIHKGQSVPFSLPQREFGAGFAFPADQRLTDDEAIALVLLLSES